jgi:GTP-binding protein EngB required for normal cell division
MKSSSLPDAHDSRILVSSALERVACLAEEWKLENLRPQIAACRELLQRRDGIDVAVFGRFKAGKSSFLNHLVGRPVLPIGVVPLTAVITRLRYGPSEGVKVSFLDGARQTIPLSEVGLYVDEKENPDNVKRVASVEIDLPELQPFAPLEFVDTPGLGSAFVHNTEAALNWLPNVGAALVAVSSDAPLSERDLTLLEQLRQHTPKIVLLLTKADLLTESQRFEVLSFVHQQLRRKWDAEIPVYFYSIKPELSELKGALKEQLLLPLIQRRGEAGAQILRHKLASLTHQTASYLHVALAAATQAESARQALQARLDEERQHWELLREELHGLSYEWAAKALERSLDRLEPARAYLRAKVTTELQAQYPQWSMRLPPFIAAWREWMQSFLYRELAEISRVQRAMFCEPLKKAHLHLARMLRAFQDRLAGHVKEALGVILAPREFTLEVHEPSAPPVDVGYGFDVALDIVGYLVPMTLLRRPIEEALTRKARWEVEKNLSRLAAAWRDRVAEAISELTQQAERYTLSELGAIEQSLGRTMSDAAALKRAIAEVEASHAQLLSA